MEAPPTGYRCGHAPAAAGSKQKATKPCLSQRILLVQRLLEDAEDTEETVDRVAERAGFGNALALRHHFRAWRGTTPAAYRSAFRASGAAGPRHGPPGQH